MSDKLIEMEQDANKKYYFRELDSSQVSEFLSRMISESGEIYLWRKGQTKEKMECFQSIGVEGQTIQIKIKGLLANLARSSNENEEVFIKICLKKKQFFSNSLLYVGDDGNYCLDIKEVVFEGLRRRDYRLNAGNRIKIKLEIEEEIYDCMDVSAGGVSLMLDKKAAKSFTKGISFKDCILALNKKRYPIIEANVVGRWDVKNEDDEPMIKVGVTFADMKEHINEKLCVHINSEAREEEILKELASKRKSG